MMPQFLRYRTARDALGSLLLAALFALLIAMLAPRLPAVAIWLLAGLAVWDLAASLRRSLRALRRAGRLQATPGLRTRAPRPLPLPWALYQAWLALAVLALAWRLLYLGMPFLPLVLPTSLELAWGAAIGGLGAAALILLARLGHTPPCRLPAAGWRDALALAAAAALSVELFLRAAAQPTVGWPAAAALAAMGYLALGWRGRAWGWGLVMAGVSLGLGWVFDWSASLWGPFVGHGLVALVAVALAREAVTPATRRPG